METSHPSSVPVLFLIFNRPVNALKVFNEIRKSKPAKLFVAADGPRSHVATDESNCAATRALIKKIDWECEVKTLFRTENLGCKMAVKTGIDWFFTHVEHGIILEDDCIPVQSFFPFCKKMLQLYAKDPSVGIVSGTNYLLGKYQHKDAYFLSHLFPMWGWATWKSTWDLFSFNIEESAEEIREIVFRKITSRQEANNIAEMIILTKENKINAWSPFLLFQLIKKNLYSVTPTKNLISNIGIEGTHPTKNISLFINLKRSELDLKKLSLCSAQQALVLDNLSYKNIVMVNKLDNKPKSALKLLMERIRDSFFYRSKKLFKLLRRSQSHSR